MLRPTAPTARRTFVHLGKTRPPRGWPDYGRATPSLRQPIPGAFLILIVAQFSPCLSPPMGGCFPRGCCVGGEPSSPPVSGRPVRFGLLTPNLFRRRDYR